MGGGGGSYAVPELASRMSDDGGVVPSGALRNDAKVIAAKQHVAWLFPGMRQQQQQRWRWRNGW